MALSGDRVTVTTSATEIVASDADGISCVIRVPSGGSDVDVGASDVASGSDFLVAGGESVSLTLDSGESIYGIVASGTQVVHVLKNRA